MDLEGRRGITLEIEETEGGGRAGTEPDLGSISHGIFVMDVEFDESLVTPGQGHAKEMLATLGDFAVKHRGESLHLHLDASWVEV